VVDVARELLSDGRSDELLRIARRGVVGWSTTVLPGVRSM
jgi:hypothetical protein